jgi:tRNA pseudouridine38-40 synthase
MRPYKLILSYDGTAYFGWQKTAAGPSIQESLSTAIRQITQEEVTPEAASRTDRGVHATGQVVAFTLKKEWEPEALQKALNGTLPRDIRVQQITWGSPLFHPTLSAVEKEYRYWISLGPVQDPIHRLYSWAFRYPLDLDKMKRAAAFLLGTRDFSSFANEEKDNPICHIKSIEIAQEELLEIRIRGDRFLYKMARNIAGTLVYVGCGKLSATSIRAILASKDRKKAGVTAPAHGLTLYSVDYLE